MLDMMKRWHTHVNPITYTTGDKFISASERINIVDFLVKLCAAADPVRTAVSCNTVWVYSNNLDFLKGLADTNYSRRSEITEVLLDRPRDSVKLRKSDYQYRTYFRDCNLTQENRQYLENWLRNQQNIRVSTGLQEFLDRGWRNLYSNYFFDHNDTRLTQMLGLIVPRAVKTTKTIVIADK